MKSDPKRRGKGSSSFNVSGVLLEDLVNDDDSNMDPPKIYNIKDDKEESEQENDKTVTSTKVLKDWIIVKDHSLDNILGEIHKRVYIRIPGLIILVISPYSYIKLNQKHHYFLD